MKNNRSAKIESPHLQTDLPQVTDIAPAGKASFYDVTSMDIPLLVVVGEILFKILKYRFKKKKTVLPANTSSKNLYSI